MSIIFLPIVLPFLAAALILLLPKLKSALALGSLVGALGISVLLLQQTFAGSPEKLAVSAWRYPGAGITLLADGLSSGMLLVILGVGILVLSHTQIFFRRQSLGRLETAATLLFLGASCGAVLTTDFFNLFVWFELILMSSCCLLSLSKTRDRLAAAFKFLIINWISSLLLLTTCGLLYAFSGSLSMALAGMLPNSSEKELLGTLFSLCFLVKAAAFPLFAWLPPNYGILPPSLSALMAGVSTKVGVYALIRSHSVGLGMPSQVMFWIAGLTMVVGAIGALAQQDLRRTLAYHVISQIGYMLFGLAIATPLAIGATFIHLAHNALIKAGIFLWCEHPKSDLGTLTFQSLKGYGKRSPAISFMFIVLALALIGIPPLSGFVSKFSLIQAAVLSGQAIQIIVPLAVSLLTLTYLIPYANAMNHKELASPNEPRKISFSHVPVIAALAMAVGIGLFASPLLNWAQQVGKETLDVQLYYQNIYGDQRP